MCRTGRCTYCGSGLGWRQHLLGWCHAAEHPRLFTAFSSLCCCFRQHGLAGTHRSRLKQRVIHGPLYYHTVVQGSMGNRTAASWRLRMGVLREIECICVYTTDKIWKNKNHNCYDLWTFFTILSLFLKTLTSLHRQLVQSDSKQQWPWTENANSGAFYFLDYMIRC